MRSHKMWTEQDDQLLAKLYCSGVHRDTICKQLNRPLASIRNRIRIKRLTRPTEMKNTGQFRKAVDTPNESQHSNRLPNTWKPIGTIREIANQPTRIKVRDTGKQSDWIPLHNVIWEKERGPIPPGHFVRYCDGDVKNVSIDNLILVTRAENAIANSWLRQGPLPEGGIKAVILLAKLKERMKKSPQ